jgi:hypothetical protein
MLNHNNPNYPYGQTFYQNADWNQSDNQMNQGFPEQNSTPITITWNVNAYIKTSKNLPTRIKNILNRKDYDDYDYSKFYYNPQVQEDVEPDIKHILKNGMKYY